MANENEDKKKAKIAWLKKLATEKGLTYRQVKYCFDKVIKEKDKDLNERRELFHSYLAEAQERNKKKTVSKIGNTAIYNNAMLCELYKHNHHDYNTVMSDYRYCVSVNGEYLHFSIGDTKNASAEFDDITFHEFLILSAIYSQIERYDGVMDEENRYIISLRSIYECLHGKKTKWCRVSADDIIKLRHEIMLLILKLNNMTGEYYSKKTKLREFDSGSGFFLKGAMYRYVTPNEKNNEIKALQKEGYHNSFVYISKPAFLDICLQQSRITTIPDDMLDIETEHENDDVKLYIAFWVKVVGKSKLEPAIRFSTLKDLFGDDHRKMVRRYAKFLEDKGYITNLRLDRDAIRWDKVKEQKEKINALQL
ncbi:MAG: hypothetical protein K5787_12970 [Lentisphaeria bacterium]|nr:hypothetical protein [Lentisphaeria bacterium]